jgi:hypothetical protein
MERATIKASRLWRANIHPRGELAMRYFLSDERRSKLVVELMNLSMPALLAQECAGVKDDLSLVDDSLEAVVETLVKVCADLASATLRREHEQEQTMHTLIDADLVIIRSFLGEIRDQGVVEVQLPRFNRAVHRGISKVGLCQRLLLAEMPCATFH